MDLGLKGKNAAITGSSQGIGEAIAMSLAAEGCNVAINGRDEERINKVVAADALDDEVAALAGRLAAGPARAYAHTKALMNQSFENALRQQLDAEARGFADCTTTDDFAEGVSAFVAKRKPDFRGT